MDVINFEDSGEVRRYNKGDAVCIKGVTSNEMFIVLGGLVGIIGKSMFGDEQGGNADGVTLLKEHDIFGEMCLFGGLASDVTAVSFSDNSAVLVVNKDNAEHFIRSQPAFALKVLQNLTQQVLALKGITADNVPNAPSGFRAPLPDFASGIGGRARKSKPAWEVLGICPEKHSVYNLEIPETHMEFLIPIKIACPVCRDKITVRNQRLNKLKVDKIDNDFRTHYLNYERLFYSIYTCPSCLYSNNYADFVKPLGPKARQQMQESLEQLKQRASFTFTDDININTIFLKYYLAIYCANVPKPDTLRLGKLYMNLAWLYQDLKDDVMQLEAFENAFSFYKQTLDNPPPSITADQEQNLYMIMAELYHKKGDLQEAQRHFFAAAKSGSSTSILTKMAQDRIQDLRMELSGKL